MRKKFIIAIFVRSLKGTERPLMDGNAEDIVEEL